MIASAMVAPIYAEDVSSEEEAMLVIVSIVVSIYNM